MGMSNSDTNEGLTEDPEKSTGYLSAGTNRCMCANRISYHFDFKGKETTTLLTRTISV